MAAMSKRMKAAVSALSDGQVPLDVKLTQLVKLDQERRAVQDVQAGRDVCHPAGRGRSGRCPDVTRFRDADAQDRTRRWTLILTRCTEQSKDNPVFYVQLRPYARVQSVLRSISGRGEHRMCRMLTLAGVDLAAHDPRRQNWHVAKKLGEWPRLVEIAAQGTTEPHRIAFYLYELAWRLPRALASRQPGVRRTKACGCSKIGDSETTQAKIALIRSVPQQLLFRHGLGILGVTPADEMR